MAHNSPVFNSTIQFLPVIDATPRKAFARAVFASKNKFSHPIPEFNISKFQSFMLTQMQGMPTSPDSKSACSKKSLIKKRRMTNTALEVESVKNMLIEIVRSERKCTL
jgi:hypothetical protein